MNVPREPEPDELQRLLDTLEARIQLRAYDDNVQQAYGLLSQVEDEIDGLLRSPTLHRDWRASRPTLLRLVDDLDRVLR
ncbi:MAG: hypothetical protein ACRDGF_02755 [Chloroflexota bacterium]